MSRQAPPKLGRVRLAYVEDAPLIIEMVNESMAKNFRVYDTKQIVFLIENSVLAICQLDVNERIVGFIAVRDYPLIPAVHPQAWEEFIWRKYKAVELNPRNTLFIHLLCWDVLMYVRCAVDNMLKTIFMHDPYVQHIAMIKSLIEFPLLVPGQFRSESSFRRVNAVEKGVPGDQMPALCIADRSEVSPRLRIRRAVEEDNDDIVPIIEAHSKRLREIYGEFYISELISRHPESERLLLVCEHKEVAVGVLCLNTVINYEALEESFELSPFAGLRKLDQVPRGPKLPSKDIVSDGSFISNNNLGEHNQGSLTLESSPRVRDKTDKSRVTWTFEDDDFKDICEPPTPALNSFPNTRAQLDILDVLEDEDEELEFDIVNIDTDLLRVPEMLSYDDVGIGPDEDIKKILDGIHHKPDTKEPPEMMKKEKSKVVAQASSQLTEPHRYSGPPNAFLCELFAMHHDYDERYGFDILEAAFEMFPDRDYCIICFPSNQPSFPLLEHFTLVTPYSTHMKFINETLYVAHVNSIKGDLRVRRGEAYDIAAMYDVCERSPSALGLIHLFKSSLTSHTIQSYVMLSQNQPIGMVILEPLEGVTSVRTQYDLEPEPRKPGTDCMILAGILSPVLEPHSRWFMRELLRLSPYSTLFWICRLFAKGDASPSKNLMSLAGHMTPVHPRRSVPNMSGNRDLDKIYRDVSTPFALWVLERPLSSLPKVYVNNSIVVVGASRTGLAFIETLLLGPTCQYLTFNNVTLVSEHGLPTVSECLRAADTCVPRDGRYTDRYLKSVPFYFYLDVMSTVMVGIDRKNKCIHLKGGGIKYYDELVLTCGQQFQHPDYLHGPLQLVKEVELGKPCERVLMDDLKYQPDKVPASPVMPDNVMLINSLIEANLCLKKLLLMISDAKHTDENLSTENNIIVYGDCIEAYSCISALLELGIFPEMITFIEPFPPEDSTKLRVNCFNNEVVDERVQQSLEDLGVHIYRRYYLAGWQTRSNRVDLIHLMSQLKTISLPCFAMFYYGIKAINVSAFKAINESGLVYDGGLVVGPSFETNDPNVFGAGTCVKHSRRLYASPRAHRHFCSEDVGEALADLFLKKLDPFVMGTSNREDLMPRFCSSILGLNRESHISVSSSVTRLSRVATKMPTRWQPVMKFESPLVQSATFPGPLYYMKLRKPGFEIPMEVQLSLPHQGHTLITDKRNNYFRLQLNVLHCVDAVTCLSNKQFSSEILSQLYGKHEAFFNRLLIRFQMGMIDDLYEFFTQPWMSALYQETFQDLLRDINDQDVGTIYDLVQSRFHFYEDEKASLEKTSNTSCDNTPEKQHSKDARAMGAFRSVIDKYVARKSIVDIVNASKPTDIPSECGQCETIRKEASEFWDSIGGEDVVNAHLTRYLRRNTVTNPHYAVPDPTFS